MEGMADMRPSSVKRYWLYLAMAGLSLVSAAFCANGRPRGERDPNWWKHAVFYEIYPRSFADSNGDGIGDLEGIRSKLEYLKQLGVDAIWLTPCYPSPQVDFGYDVSDYENIDPIYGTLDDFNKLQQEAQKKGIRIIMDFVPNHTSDQHKWFIDSRASRNSVHRDWYIWRDGKSEHQPPNNWVSIFGGPAWQFDPATGQYYYHFFYPQQPDLNWRNPAVESAMFDVTRWWYDRGVAGFRLDAVGNLFEDPGLKDNPVLPGVNKFGDPNTENRYNSSLPEVHDALRGLRRVADQYHAVLIGETWTGNADELNRYYGKNDDELQMPMYLLFTKLEFSAPVFRDAIGAVESSGHWPVFVIGNHDIVRSYVRYGDGQHNEAIAKVMAAMYLTLRGTPIMYYGEEIGMTNNDPKRKEDVKDPIGKTGWPMEIGRDGERTPMQWDDTVNAGFTKGTPWLPLPESYRTHNVATEAKVPSSIFVFYKKLLALRRNSPVLLDGDYTALNQEDPNVLMYLRQLHGSSVLIALNLSGAAQTVKIDLSKSGVEAGNARVLLSSPASQRARQDLSKLELGPFGVYIARIGK
jgi:alpha-glucosidase